MAWSDKFVDEGWRVKITNTTGSTVDKGEPVVFGDRVFIACEEIAAAAEGRWYTRGRFDDVPADPDDDWDAGDTLYWETANEWLTITSAGNIVFGSALSDKAALAVIADALLEFPGV